MSAAISCQRVLLGIFSLLTASGCAKNRDHTTDAALPADAASETDASAPTNAPRSFQVQRLSDLFYAEGSGVGDFNKDGHLDIVAGPYWYAGPDFATKHQIYPPVAFDPHATSDAFFNFVYDFNSDGFPDVLVVGYPGQTGLWYENPRGQDGAWPKHVVVDAVGNESPAFVPNFFGDGRPVLIYMRNGLLGWAAPAGNDASVPWHFNVITTQVSYNVFTHGLGVGDVNGDGRTDIVERSGWWEQPANPGEWIRHAFDFGVGGAQMYVFDFDGDRLNDIVTSSSAHGYGLAWFQQTRTNGQVSFCRHLIMGEVPAQNRYGVVFSQLHGMAFGDIDGDGLPDLIVGKRHWAHPPPLDPDDNGPAVIYWFRTVRRADGVDFVPFLIDNNSGVGTQVTVADVNGDGLLDIVSSNKLGTFFMEQTTRLATVPQPSGPFVPQCN